MSKEINDNTRDFEHILSLITEARNRVYSNANSELVMLYFNVGKIVSDKVNEGNWGDNIVQKLANFIQSKLPSLSGFNRRGLYRMKQFYETYSSPEFVSTLATHLQKLENDVKKIVSPEATQIQLNDNEVFKFVSPLVTQMSILNHRINISS